MRVSKFHWTRRKLTLFQYVCGATLAPFLFHRRLLVMDYSCSQMATRDSCKYETTLFIVVLFVAVLIFCCFQIVIRLKKTTLHILMIALSLDNFPQRYKKIIKIPNRKKNGNFSTVGFLFTKFSFLTASFACCSCACNLNSCHFAVI